ncbi:trk system potassium uptake protein TrkA [Pilibacter termitis]|uniref:Trk system potassium uptake protein TrkA n=1 Tax=Pilibacter termitis TaxID=263852 RepID=A0A1T4M5Y5_9ENTE|nr:NAD-binding protein [Pilibacter termitis]SJZ62409.1 trk system potassium uptake protein TrkA [Pilibacter termitis]
MKKHILLIGSLNKARSLAQSLLQKKYQVTAINRDYQNCLTLAEIDGLRVIHGDATKPFVLEEASVQEVDIAIALTPCDQDNLVICELCKKKFHVRKTVSLVNDPKKTDFFYKMGIDSVICAVNTISNIIEKQTLLEGITSFFPTGEAHINIVEVPIFSTSPVVNQKIWEIPLPREVIIACILREEKTMIPRGDTTILAGDLLILILFDKQEMEVVHKLTGEREC